MLSVFKIACWWIWFPKQPRTFSLLKQCFWTSACDVRSGRALWHSVPMMTIIALYWIYSERWVCPGGWNEHTLKAREFNEQKQTRKIWCSWSPSGTLQSCFCFHFTFSLPESSFCLRSDQPIILHTSSNTCLFFFSGQLIITKANSMSFLLHLRRKWIPTN